MIYQETLVARWHDTDATLAVRPSQQLVYMQEMAFQHLNSVGRNLDRMREEASFDYWGPRGATHSVVRFVTSWSTTKEDVDRLIELI